jgi:hypothetical protein
VGVAPQVAGKSAFDEAGVGAFAVDDEELAPGAGGDERFAFDVDGLAGAAGADDQPRPALHVAGDGDQAALVGPAEIAVDRHSEGDGAEVVVAHNGGAAHRSRHAPGCLPLGAADLGGVDRLPPAREIQRRGQ